ncbi:MAG: alpha/beta hydrolase [Cellvibrionales bacterium]|nr:alpha/beta hydrolase [Cellvibrionales bacterium]
MICSNSFPIDWVHARETRFLLSGKAGAIELLVNGVQRPRALSLICHPHPLHGGSLDNKVVFTLARACRDSELVAVRFNFRGVGDSAGIYGNGIGELDDAKWLLGRIHSELPDLPIILAGFSFGAAIAAQLAQEIPCAGLLLSARLCHIMVWIMLRQLRRLLFYCNVTMTT